MLELWARVDEGILARSDATGLGRNEGICLRGLIIIFFCRAGLINEGGGGDSFGDFGDGTCFAGVCSDDLPCETLGGGIGGLSKKVTELGLDTVGCGCAVERWSCNFVSDGKRETILAETRATSFCVTSEINGMDCRASVSLSDAAEGKPSRGR